MGRRSDPRWRDRAAAELAASVVPEMGLTGPVLLVDDPEHAVAEAVREAGGAVVRWSRVDGTGGVSGRSWPPEGPYGAAFIRLPRSREALELALAAASSVLRPGSPVAVYGARDEGIVSTPDRMEGVVDDVQTRANARRCRVLVGRIPGEEAPGGKGCRLEDWRTVSEVDLGWGAQPWVSYPGTFARGGLDPGTALLLDVLPPLGSGARVLDFAAGTGVLAAAVLHRTPSAEVWMVEPDALACAAALENAPSARVAPLDGWWTRGRFDLVLSNPPYHRGKVEDLTVVESLIGHAPSALAPGGELRMVVQRRLPVKGLLEERFGRVRDLADSGPYRVWSASTPR